LDELRSSLVALVSRFALRRDEAEDVAQEALLRLHRARSNGRSVEHEEAYVRQAASRLAIDRLRAARAYDLRIREYGRQNGESAESKPPEDVQWLYEAIERLPARQAAVVTLRKLMELEYDEVARIMETSVENCRSLCRHAMARLREQLSEK